MKINTIKVKNIKAVSEFELPLSGATVMVTAGNNKGKSTILRSLIDRLRGEKPELILKQGESEGKAELELMDGSKFLWEIKEGKEKLIYTTKEGFKTSSVKEVSKRYFPEIFDIDEFLQSAPKQQVETLQKLVGIDFSKIDEEHKKLYDERTLLNKQISEEDVKIKTFTSSIDIDFMNKVLPLEIRDTSILEKEIESLNEAKIEQIQNKHSLDKIKDNLNYRISDKKRMLLQIEEYKSKLADITDKINSLEKMVNREESLIVELENEIKNFFVCETDYDAQIKKINEEIFAAKAINKEIDIARNNSARIKELNDVSYKLKEKQLNAERRLEEIKEEKLAMINGAKFPEGITIEGDQITVKGLPLSKAQIGTALLYMTALRLASMQLGEVKSLYFDASMLDKNSLEEILAWAKQNGLQLLIERADFEGGDIQYQILGE